VLSSPPYIVRSFGLFGLFGVPAGVIVTHPVREKGQCLLPLRLPCLSLRTILHPLRTADGVVSPPYLIMRCHVPGACEVSAGSTEPSSPLGSTHHTADLVLGFARPKEGFE